MEAYLEELYKKLSLAEQEHEQFLIEEEVIEETITRGENQSTDFTPYEKALQYTSFEANNEDICRPMKRISFKDLGFKIMLV